MKEDSVFTTAGEQRVKHMLAMTVRGRQLRPGWLRCEFFGMLVSLKLSRNQIQKETMGLSGLLRRGRGKEEAACLGGGVMVELLCLSTSLHTAGGGEGAWGLRATVNLVSLSTPFFPGETGLHPEPWSSGAVGAGGTLTSRAPHQAVLCSLPLPTGLQGGIYYLHLRVEETETQ